MRPLPAFCSKMLRNRNLLEELGKETAHHQPKTNRNNDMKSIKYVLNGERQLTGAATSVLPLFSDLGVCVCLEITF